MLSDYSTEELISELSKRKGVQFLKAGIYQGWELKGKYSNHKIKLPDVYNVVLITDSVE